MDKRILPNDVLLEEVAALLAEGREVIFRPKGNSMLPVIRGDRDSVVLRKFPSVSVGDILLVRLGGHYVLHRLVSREGERLVLQGDGNLRGTERCTEADVLGTVVAIENENGRRRRPGKGRIWRAFGPFRRIFLAIYRRI